MILLLLVSKGLVVMPCLYDCMSYFNHLHRPPSTLYTSRLQTLTFRRKTHRTSCCHENILPLEEQTLHYNNESSHSLNQRWDNNKTISKLQLIWCQLAQKVYCISELFKIILIYDRDASSYTTSFRTVNSSAPSLITTHAIKKLKLKKQCKVE